MFVLMYFSFLLPVLFLYFLCSSNQIMEFSNVLSWKRTVALSAFQERFGPVDCIQLPLNCVTVLAHSKDNWTQLKRLHSFVRSRANSTAWIMKHFHLTFAVVQSQQWKHQNIVSNLFKVNNKDTRTRSITSITLNRFHTLYWCLYCWILTSECRLGTAEYFCLFELIGPPKFTCYCYFVVRCFQTKSKQSKQVFVVE